MMRKILNLIKLSLIVGSLCILIALLRQKQRALEEAEARIASIERQIRQLTQATSGTQEDATLRARLAQQGAELERLRAELAALGAQAPAPAAQSAEAAHRPHQEKPGESEQVLRSLPPAKQALAEHAVKAQISPILIDHPQDLSAVEGIGPVLEQRLYQAGIGSYWELAMLDADTLRNILRMSPTHATSAKLEAIRASAQRLAEETKTLGHIWNGKPVDDFEQIPGIGEVYEQRLYQAGIRTYADLANTAPEALQQICASRSPTPPDYAAWIEAARKLATRG